MFNLYRNNFISNRNDYRIGGEQYMTKTIKDIKKEFEKQLTITTVVVDQKEITEWLFRDGLLSQEQKEELLNKGRLVIIRTEGSSTTYEIN